MCGAAGQLEVSADGLTLTGRLVGDIIDGHAKAAALVQLAAQYGVDRTQVRCSSCWAEG